MKFHGGIRGLGNGGAEDCVAGRADDGENVTGKVRVNLN